MVLPRLTVLDERYAIGRTLDATEPLIVSYQAWNLHTEDQVILEEFFPAPLIQRVEGGLAVEAVDAEKDELFRYGRDQFLKEGAVLATVKHPNLVEVLERFEAQNTAYRILAHHKGATLASVMEKQDGKLPVKTAFSILMPLLDGLQAAHQRGLIHGAFSPKAVFLAKGRGPMLRGFRTTHVMMAQRTGNRQLLITDGVSAPEQYEAGGRQGPWTDVYGSAATLFQMLTGKMVPPAPRRREHDEAPALLQQTGNMPDAVRTLLEKALSLDSARRPRSVQSFQQKLIEALKENAKVQVQAPAEKPAAPAATPAPEPAAEAKLAPTPPPAPTPEAQPAETPVQEAPAEPALAEPAPVQTAPAAPAPVEPAPAKAAKAEEPAPKAAEPKPAAPKAAEPKKPVPETPQPAAAAEEREDQSAQAMATEAAKKQAAQKMVVEKLAARKEAEQKAADEEAKPKRRNRAAKKRASADRPAASPRRRGMPVLAALAVVVLVALSGAFVLMQGQNKDLSRFAYYKAQGDSLFAVANYMEAKTQYEFALATAPNNEYVTGRLSETEQRLIEVQDDRYAAYVGQGDALFATADSLLKRGEALAALSSFAEANKAYYAALQYRPEDPLVLEKGQLTSARMQEASSRNQQPAGEGASSEESAQDISDQLYKSYRQQGDQLFARGDYAEARQKYLLARNEKPNDEYIAAKIVEVDERLAVTGQEEQFEELFQKGITLLADERYAEAQIAFRQALDVKPNEQRALDGLNRADSMLDRARRDEHYQQFREQGDVLLAQENYSEALSRFEQALDNKPGDAYVQEKIDSIRQTLAAQQGAQEPEEQPQPQRNEPEDGIYTVVDTAPELIGGLKELHDKVVYPERAYESGTEGRVYIQFVVTENGEVQDAEVMRGLGQGCDEEALRVVKEARFVPGKIGVRSVKVRHTLFITFKLK